MLKTLPALAAVALLALPAQAEPAERLVTVVTAAEPQTQLMSMVLTMQAVAKGVDTRILLCGPAGDIALKDAPETATAGQPPKGMSPQGLLQAAMEKGAKAEVCAIYLPGKGAGPEALLDGVTVAAPPAMADALLDDDAAIWSF
ncbi:DsrE family protein [Actibacterium ureilyticum]|uniref:DsrE family protein n=1 Tax=Actibacterium ureilyticum TaxID=1590614 RepID=UPI000BAAF04D|nr:DsrE family protein [Actibacterium ureilyticum]